MYLHRRLHRRISPLPLDVVFVSQDSLIKGQLVVDKHPRSRREAKQVGHEVVHDEALAQWVTYEFGGFFMTVFLKYCPL